MPFDATIPLVYYTFAQREKAELGNQDAPVSQHKSTNWPCIGLQQIDIDIQHCIQCPGNFTAKFPGPDIKCDIYPI